MNASRIPRIATVLIGLWMTGVTQASTVTAGVSGDWSQFSITGIDIGFGLPAISWNSRDTTASMQVFVQSGADTGASSQFATFSNWTTPLDAFGALLGTHASANANAASVGVQTSNGAGFAFTSASVSRGGSFSVAGTGLVMFSLPYEVSALAAIDSDASFADSGSVSSQISISASAFGPSQSSNANETVFGNVFAGFPGDTQSFALSGVLYAVLSVQDGSSGFFSINASANSSAFLMGGHGPMVPLPAAIWLLAGALVGLLGFRPARSH